MKPPVNICSSKRGPSILPGVQPLDFPNRSSEQSKTIPSGNQPEFRREDYGYYEARLKIVAGSGWHSAFWLMGYNSIDTKGNKAILEMDVIENESADPLSYSTTTHRWVPLHIARGHKDITTPNLSKGFHIVAASTRLTSSAITSTASSCRPLTGPTFPKAT
jgi:hypothetical protein